MTINKFVSSQKITITTQGTKIFYFTNVAVYDKSDYFVQYKRSGAPDATVMSEGSDYFSTLNPITPSGQQPPSNVTMALNTVLITFPADTTYELLVGDEVSIQRNTKVEKVSLFDRSTYYTIEANNYSTEVLQLAIKDAFSTISNIISRTGSGKVEGIATGPIASFTNSNGIIVEIADPKYPLLRLTPADTTNGGVLTATTQSIGGDKTFHGTTTFLKPIVVNSHASFANTATFLKSITVNGHIFDGTNAGGGTGGGGTVDSVTGENSVRATSSLGGVVVDNTDPKNPTIQITAADENNPGALTTTAQKIAGEKTFTSDILGQSITCGGKSVFNGGLDVSTLFNCIDKAEFFSDIEVGGEVKLTGVPKRPENTLPVVNHDNEQSSFDTVYAEIYKNPDGVLGCGKRKIVMDKPLTVPPAMEVTPGGTDVGDYFSTSQVYKPAYYTGEAYEFKGPGGTDSREKESFASFQISYRGFVPPEYIVTSQDHGQNIPGIWDNVYTLDRFDGVPASTRILKVEGSVSLPFHRVYNKNPFSSDPDAIDAWHQRPLSNFPGLVVEMSILNPDEKKDIRDLDNGHNATLYLLNTKTPFESTDKSNMYNGWRELHPDPAGGEFFITVTFLEDKASAKKHILTGNAT